MNFNSQAEEMAFLFGKDYSLGAIAERLGVHRETVRRALISFGIDTSYHARKSVGAKHYGCIARDLRSKGLAWSVISDRLGYSERQLRRYAAN